MTTLQDAWSKVAGSKPKLRSDIKHVSHDYRGQNWIILSDSLSDSNFICTLQTFAFIQSLDGNKTLEEAVAENNHQLSFALDQQEILTLIATLQSKDMLEGLPSDSKQLLEKRSNIQRKTNIQRIARPLSIKLSLWNPNDWLSGITPKIGFLFSPASALLLTLLLLFGILNTAIYWADLSLYFSTHFLDPKNILLIWLLYPVIKFLHELGHAVVTKHWGGDVRDMGIMLLVFFPVPYVDASSSYLFVNKYQRMLVAGAGILVELLLATVAILCWLQFDNGWMKDVAFNVAVLAGASTIFINGNPLLRFDGYYVFAEAIEIPNLAKRSNQYLGAICQRLLLGINPQHEVSARSTGEKRWLLCYSLASGLYRLIISFSIAMFVAGRFFWIGVALALWFVLYQISWPAWLALKHLYDQAIAQSRQRQLATRLSLCAGLVFVLFFIIPLHSWTNLQGIVSLPQNSVVRAKSDGFLTALLSTDGDTIGKNTPIVQLSNENLATEISALKSELAALDIRAIEAGSKNILQAQILQQQRQANLARLEELETEFASLTIKSPADGRLIIPNYSDSLGRFFKKGDTLAYVTDLTQVTIATAMPEDQLSVLQKGIHTVEVKLAGDPSKTLAARLIQDTPRANNTLTSALLGSAQGGDIRVDARDEAGLQTLEAIYQLEFIIDDYNADYLGARADLKIKHPGQPLAHHLYDFSRRIFLQNFQL